MTQGLRLWVVRRVALVALIALGATMIGVAALPPVGATVDPPVFETKWGTLGGPLRGPYGVAVDGSGNVYVADTDHGRIQKFTSAGVFVTQWGTFGTDDGQFLGPRGVAVDGSGNVYVTDSDRVQKFTSAGVFITTWGTNGTGDGQFDGPEGVAVDGSGNVYVADTYNDRIQKFTSTGVFVTKWGTSGTGDGQFLNPQGVAVDGSGNVYVSDTGNHRIQKFTSTGTFITKWGTDGTGDGQFEFTGGVAVDESGNVYVTDTNNHRIQKFTSTGVFVAKWGTSGTGNGQFNFPEGVAADGSGNVYVTDTQNNRVQKFTSAGVFVTKWNSAENTGGQFHYPAGAAVDESGNVYVADSDNHRIQKFTSAGVFVTQWGTRGSSDGEFFNPWSVAVDGSGNVYVADSGNHRVQKFTSAGVFITQWGTYGFGDGQFRYPYGVAVDGSGNVYVADTQNDRIQKFTSTGVFITKWGTSGTGNGQFNSPDGVAVDGSGNVYVTGYPHRIQKSTSAGVFITQWGTNGTGDGQFRYPGGVAVDGSGNVYVADTNNDRIQKFTSTGVFITKWGTSGTGDGQFGSPQGVAVDGSGNVYVTDLGNHRVQKFTSADSPTGVSGTVTESGSGAPVAGAWVAVLRTSDYSVAGGGVADGSGNFTAPVAAGSYYLYVVDSPGAHTAGFHGPPTTVTVTAGNTTDADPQMVSLRGAIAGTVTESGSGSPIGGAWVIGINATTGATQQGVVANGAGQYNIGGLRAGSYRPVFVDPTGAHGSRYFPNSVDFLGATSLTVTAGGSTAANVALPTQSTTPGAQTLSGTVREAGTNTALAGVFVVALRASDFRNAGGAVTNASGQYSLNVAAGDYKLAFVDSTGLHNMEWHDNQPNTGLATATSVTAPAVTNAALDANTGSMAGTVTDDPSGTPITGAWVVAIGPTGNIAGGAVTSGAGTYTIAGLAPGTYRATIVDPIGGRTQEYYNNSPDYAGATPVNVTAGGTATVNAALALP